MDGPRAYVGLSGVDSSAIGSRARVYEGGLLRGIETYLACDDSSISFV